MCSCRGIYFSLDQADVQLLLDAPNDREVLRIIQEDIEARWDEENLLLLDKSWDAIHRCLTDGTLTCKQKNIKEKVIIGGRQLYKGSAYIISLKTSSEVQEIVESLQKINKQWFSEKFYGLRKKDRGSHGPHALITKGLLIKMILKHPGNTLKNSGAFLKKHLKKSYQ